MNTVTWLPSVALVGSVLKGTFQGYGCNAIAGDYMSIIN